MEIAGGSGGLTHCSACSSLACPQTPHATSNGRRPTASAVRIAPTSSQPTNKPSSVFCRSALWGFPPVHYLSSFGSLPLPQFQPIFQDGRPLDGSKRCGIARSYMESNNPILKFFSKVQGALPVVGLLSRLASGTGGIGTDRIRFEEFCTRVGRNCTRDDTRAFYTLSARYGKSAKPQFMLIWCWAAAVGAGLLRSEDLLMGASRLRVSYDLQFEVENFDLLMDEATQRREKSGSKIPDVPMESRAEKALEAMCKCCTGSTVILEEDAPVYVTIMKVVFPTADQEQIEDMVASRLVDPSTIDAAAASGDSQFTSDEAVTSSQKAAEIDAVVTSQMFDPLNDEDLDEDDGQYSDDTEAQSSVQDSPQSMPQELMQ